MDNLHERSTAGGYLVPKDGQRGLSCGEGTPLTINTHIDYPLTTLSGRAIQDLRITLRTSYGAGFESALSDEEVNKVGMLVLTCLMEGLKVRWADKL